MTSTRRSHTILTHPFHLVAVPTSCGKWPRFVCFVAWRSVQTMPLEWIQTLVSGGLRARISQPASSQTCGYARQIGINFPGGPITDT
jgi:hypothetical protein